MRQIARWYDVDVVFRGPLPEGEFNGVIPRKKAVAELLAVLEQTDEVHFTIEGRKIIVEAGKRRRELIETTLTYTFITKTNDYAT
jgi:transmembrane sensor